MQPRTYACLAVVGAALVAAGVYFIPRWLATDKKPDVIPDIGAPRQRDPIVVPKMPFTDVTNAAGLRFSHTNGSSGQKLLPETMGPGVAIFDYDGDGKQDVLFVNSCPWPGHEGPKTTPVLFHNLGGGSFENVTEKVGLNVSLFGQGVAVGDIDNDGFPDVFISGVGGHKLFRNDGGKRFLDVTREAGVGGDVKLPDCDRKQFIAWEPPIPFGSSCTFLDYDGDARLDLFVCHYVRWSPKIDLNIGATLRGGSRAFVQPREFEGAHCRLYRNIDGKKFEDVSARAGIEVSDREGTGPNARVRAVGKSLGVVVCDPDEDGWPDIVVANDTVRNFFFHNKPGPGGTRVFEEEGNRVAVAYPDEGKPRGGMGIDWGEYRPGRNALVIANFANEPSTFLSLDSPKQLLFADTALSVGVAGPSRRPLKFGAFFFDGDLDGRLDLLTANGHIEPDIATIQASQTFAQPAQLFWNTGNDDCLFEPVTREQAGPDLFAPMVGRGSAYGDLDGDGDLDLVLTANGGPARLLRNDQKLGHHWVRLTLIGDGKKSNVSAIGAQVTVEAGGQVMRRQVTGGRGYLSQSELPLTVGLGKTTKVDRVTVRWPGKDGGTETWTDVPVDRPHELRQGTAKAK